MGELTKEVLDDLQTRVEEIEAWHKTGVLPGTALRDYAARVRKDFHLDMGGALIHAEKQTLHEAAAAMRLLRRERDEAHEVLDSREREYGISSEGNMWRFWANLARDTSDDCKADREKLQRVRAAISAGPHLGAKTPEPSLREVLFKYYRQAFEADEAIQHTDAYLKKIGL